MEWWQVDPRGLPELDTLGDILLDIEDTDEYQSGNIILNIYAYGSGNNETKKVVFYETDIPRINPYDFDIEGDLFEMPTMVPSIGIKRTEYEVTKLLIVLNIELSNVSLDTKHLVHETIKRIEDYVNDDNLIEINHNLTKIGLKTLIYKYRILTATTACPLISTTTTC